MDGVAHGAYEAREVRGYACSVSLVGALEAAPRPCGGRVACARPAPPPPLPPLALVLLAPPRLAGAPPPHVDLFPARGTAPLPVKFVARPPALPLPPPPPLPSTVCRCLGLSLLPSLHSELDADVVVAGSDPGEEGREARATARTFRIESTLPRPPSPPAPPAPPPPPRAREPPPPTSDQPSLASPQMTPPSARAASALFDAPLPLEAERGS